MRERSNRPARAYAAIPNAAMRDERLSMDARGMLALLMTYADTWEFRADHLRKVAGKDGQAMGEERFARVMKELAEAGYVERIPKRGERGRLEGSEWIIRDVPDRTPAKPGLGPTKTEENRDPVKPTPGKPGPIRKPTDQENQSVCSADAAQHTHPAFEDFWEAYPRPKDRDGTERAFAQAVANGADPVAIIAGARVYADENDGNRRMYLAFPVNWLKAERWKDHKANLPKEKPDAAAFWADQINADAFIPQSAIPPHLAREMIERELCKPERLKAKGLIA